jgi:hypothetical protein
MASIILETASFEASMKILCLIVVYLLCVMISVRTSTRFVRSCITPQNLPSNPSNFDMGPEAHAKSLPWSIMTFSDAQSVAAACWS